MSIYDGSFRELNIDDSPLREYLWIVIVGTMCGFVYAFGIGANDVANAFASTVASGSLTLKQAVLVASIFEFSGAFFLGAAVTSTVRSKIFDLDLYDDEPEIVMLGMFTSLFAATIMLLVATHWGLPVSTTHTIVGAIMGFSICAKGFDSIEWDVVNKIFMSWLISPLVSGVLALCMFLPLRLFVLRRENAFHRTYYVFPIVLFVGIGIDLFYILNKGINNLKVSKRITLEFSLSVSFGIGLFCGFLWLAFVGPWAMRRITQKYGNPVAAKAEAESDSTDGDDAKANADVEKSSVHEIDSDSVEMIKEEKDVKQDMQPTDVSEEEKQATTSFLRRLGNSFAENTYKQDLHSQSMHENKRAAELWDEGEQFDTNAELLFTYVQVFTACLNSFAHGANDVANAIAPISAILLIYQDGALSSKAPVQKWILAYGGIGLILGLLLYGYKVMKSLGYKMTKLSPSRGSCAELSASLFVVTASFLEIPVSSTQSIVGAVAGVGLAGGVKNMNWLFLARVCAGWVVVFFTAVIFSAGCFSFLAFSPSLSSPVGTYAPPADDAA